MKPTLFLVLSAGVLFLLVDMIWLTVVARGLYLREIGSLLLERPNLAAAAAFYVLYLAGLTFFVLLPGLESGSLLRVLLTGAAFGLVAYGTYDLTNLATLKGFTPRIAVIDMTWGATLTGFVSMLSVAITQRLA